MLDQMLIDGKTVQASDGRLIEIENPANHKIIAKVPRGGDADVERAVAAGNTLVLKAAEDAPLALLRIAQICNEHLPAGVLNLLTGYGEEAGAALARHPLVRKLSFTGSTEVGKLIMHAAADRIVPVSLEL